MNCLKCGKETTGTAVFCDACLEIMDTHPVKPGTPVQILQRTSAERRSAAWQADPEQQGRTPAQQVIRLQRSIRWLYGAVALLSLLLCITGIMLLRSLDEEPVSVTTTPIGRNYTAVDSSRLP